MLITILVFFILNLSSVIGTQFFQRLVGNYKHNNEFTVNNVQNLFWCVPPGSENCARALSFDIARNSSFKCELEVVILLNFLFCISKKLRARI